MAMGGTISWYTPSVTAIVGVHGIYAIYDHPHPSGLAATDVVSAMLDAGADVVQLRAKRASVAERFGLIERLGPMCLAAGVPLVVNDDAALATVDMAGVRGVHLGQGDLVGAGLPELASRLRSRGQWLGVSTHDLRQVSEANAAGADYLGFGPVFATQSKDRPDPVVGVDGLARACERSAAPVVAIGGITFDRVGACVRAGAAAVAIIGALRGNSAREIAARVRRVRRGLDEPGSLP
ncbi:MAG: thiamine phosphate synthase [Myxococcales bacterium FL481]|nr:MAG: thiamine phosphate synthase [Myxococcales bacterium FL481]